MASYFPYSSDDDSFLFTMPAGYRQRRLALITVLAAAALFLIGLPFARVQLPAIWAFIPIYESWLVLLDLITAVLLFGQYAILRSGGEYLPHLEDVQRIADLGMQELPFGQAPKRDGNPT
jgi:hypothetical protein